MLLDDGKKIAGYVTFCIDNQRVGIVQFHIGCAAFSAEYGGPWHRQNITYVPIVLAERPNRQYPAFGW